MVGEKDSIEKKLSLKDFGIKKEMTTHEYVLWLDSGAGTRFLRSIESRNRNFGDYWTMHEAKSLMTTKYAKYNGA